MPTKEDFDELLANCTSAWTDNYNSTGIKGRIFTSKTNSNTLFLPAAGYFADTSNSTAGTRSDYWSSSLYADYASYAYFLTCPAGTPKMDNNGRRIGKSVRPVCK